MTFWPRLAGETGATAAELTRANFVAREIFGSLRAARRAEDLRQPARRRPCRPGCGSRCAPWSSGPRGGWSTTGGRRWTARAPSTFFREPVQQAMAELPELMTGRELDGVPASARDGARGAGRARGPRDPGRGAAAGVHAARHRRDRRPRGPRPGRGRPACTSRSASGSGCPPLVQRILALPRDDRWQTMARAALRDDLHAVHTQLTAQVLAATSPDDSAPARIAAWEDDDERRGQPRRRPRSRRSAPTTRPTWPGCRSGCGWSAGCSTSPDDATP